jgi:hypothetical protein
VVTPRPDSICGPQNSGERAGCGASGPEDPRPKILGHIGRGTRRMTRGGVASLAPSQRAGSQRLRDSSTTPRWLKSRYPQPSLICSTLPETRFCGPCGVRMAKCLIHIEAAALDRLRAMRRPKSYGNVILRLFETIATRCVSLRHALSLPHAAARGHNGPLLRSG